METIISSTKQELIIGDNRPTVIIGERINPTGKKWLAEALKNNDFDSIIRKEAREQVRAGADILDVNVGEGGVEEVAILPQVLELVMQEVDVPLCIDSENPRALEAALGVYKGKALVNSVKGEDSSLDAVLPLIKEYGAAVIALPIDVAGVPKDCEGRLNILDTIIERCVKIGIPMEDIVVDCLALSVALERDAGLIAIEAIREVKRRYGVNITMGASNISFSLPERDNVNHAFLAVAIASGLTCPIVDAAKATKTILATDLVLGRDRLAMRYIRHYRSQHQVKI